MWSSYFCVVFVISVRGLLIVDRQKAVCERNYVDANMLSCFIAKRESNRQPLCRPENKYFLHLNKYEV